MGFLSRFREKTKTLTLPMLLAAATTVGGALAARTARADEIVPIVAHLTGLNESVWRSDVGVYNPFSYQVTVDFYATPRGESADPDASPVLTRVLDPHTTLDLEDVYAQIHGSASGADRLRLQFHDADGNLVANLPVSASTYNQAGPGEEFGLREVVFDPATGYEAAGTTLVAQLSKDGYRDGIIINTGDDGATIQYTYRNAAGGNETTVTKTYGPDMTYQHTDNAQGLLGFAPEANGSLEALITDGSARVALTHNNNQTNDPAWDQMSVKPSAEPQIVGIDYDGDGIADNVDANHDGILDNTINASCTAPFPYKMNLIVSPSGTYNYFGTGVPQGMGVDSGTGQIVYDPPCSDAGQTFTPAFYVNGMTTSVETTFRVTN